MRLIVVGCEYTGKSTLINSLDQWSKERGIHFHLDDHFTIPDTYFLSKEDQEAMVSLSPTIKERYQRFQIYYHIDVLRRQQHMLVGGYHIEEAIYGPLYYHYERPPYYIRDIEPLLPADTILLLLTSRPEVIAQRMEEHPHSYSIIKQEDLPFLLKRFEEEFNESLLKHKMRIDTSDSTPEESLERFLTAATPYLDPADPMRKLVQA